MVSLSLSATSTDITAQQTLIYIGNVPEGFRPKTTLYVMVVASLLGIPLLIYISIAGDISVLFRGNLQSGTPLYTSLLYIAD